MRQKTQVLSLGDNPTHIQLFADRTKPPLDVVKELKLLGLTIDSSLTYKAHVKSVCDKVNAKVAALRRVRKFIPADVMINIYKAFILPHLEYCAPVLVGLSSGLSNKLEFTNQFAIRTLMNLPKTTPYSDLLKMDDLMEDLFKSLLIKRRPRQLSSESSSDTSPEAKRLKEKESPSSPEQRDEGDDIILRALDMSENLQKSLEDILKKLEKLDAIEVANTKDTLEIQNSELREKLKLVEDKHLYLEAYSRRENLRFENIPEDATNKEDTETALRSFMETHLGFRDAANVEIQRVHLVGKKKDDKPRTIIACFLRFKDVEKLLSLGHRQRGTNYKVYQDLPFEIVDRRKKQMDTFKNARRNDIPTSFSKSQPDKLYIRGKLWPSEKPFEL
ncbi:hypothetical protein ACROYT_G033261 [Oculina patagonica]